MEFNTVSLPVTNYNDYKNILTQNSTKFDNTSIKTDYVNSEIKHYESTENNIMLYTNILYTNYKSRLLAKCTIKSYRPEMVSSYCYKPEKVSMDEYGTPDLWYLIMFLNDCEDISDFCNFSYLKLPDMQDVLTILQDEEFIKSRDTATF